MTVSGLTISNGLNLQQWLYVGPLSETAFYMFYFIGQMVLLSLAQIVFEQL